MESYLFLLTITALTVNAIFFLLCVIDECTVAIIANE